MEIWQDRILIPRQSCFPCFLLPFPAVTWTINQGEQWMPSFYFSFWTLEQDWNSQLLAYSPWFWPSSSNCSELKDVHRYDVKQRLREASLTSPRTTECLEASWTLQISNLLFVHQRAFNLNIPMGQGSLNPWIFRIVPFITLCSATKDPQCF